MSKVTHAGICAIQNQSDWIFCVNRHEIDKKNWFAQYTHRLRETNDKKRQEIQFELILCVNRVSSTVLVDVQKETMLSL